MRIVYAREPYPAQNVRQTIFLAGPTPRDLLTPSWRRDALLILEALGFAGDVYVPEARTPVDWNADTWRSQVEWERDGLARADCIVYWIPRDMKWLPGLTTNVEFGEWYSQGRFVLGAPDNAPAMGYLRHVAAEAGHLHVEIDLRATLQAAIAFTEEHACIRHGELAQVPSCVARTDTFRAWHGNLRSSHRQLESFRLQWALWVGPHKEHLLAWAAAVSIYLRDEGRSKANEVVVARPPVSATVLHGPVDPAAPLATQVVLVREFRSPVNNPLGAVYEVPSGSSFRSPTPQAVAMSEVHEEVGLRISPARYRPLETRQSSATLSAHQVHGYAVELTPGELATLAAPDYGRVTRGNRDEGEATRVEVWPLSDLLYADFLDWTNLGLITRAVLARNPRS